MRRMIRHRPITASLVLLALLALLIVLLAMPRGAAATDLHAFWDSRCADCHRHAGEFARDHFKVKDGRLVGRNPSRNICEYLIGHGAGFTMSKPICEMLTAQAATPSLFKEKCAGCHETAAHLARTGLVKAEDGTLKGKDNGRPVAEFLTTHGKLQGDEVKKVVETLTRVHKEVSQ